MLMAHEKQTRPSSNNKFLRSGKFLYTFFVLGTALAISGCQYFNFGQPSAFSASQSGSAALINLKPNRVVQTRTSPVAVTSVSANPYFGNAAHICSPSGFGQQSHCFLRGSGPLSFQNI
ncbi:hypothetical protein [Mesorhizobium silamurunense]|uniref:hypothetical protein n=1 Tax=Mesorhizobium silamurunense TaxID=499528 RepID=UPI0017869575|nr:hypothetical protein [Mesorhizobium silamurunense]